MATKLPSQLKIALVHENLTINGGAEKVLYELHTLFPSAPIYTPLYRPERFPEFRDATIITSSLNRFGWFRKRQQLLTPLMPYLMEQFDLSSYDLVISSSVSAAKGVLTRPETLHICYCHTPMRWAWMPYLDTRASGSLLRRLTAHYLRIWDSATVTRVDRWLANSKTIRERIRKFYNREAKVIYPPVKLGHHSVSHTHGGFYLSVCRLEQIKRVDIIVQAAREAGFPVKIVGRGPELANLKRLAGGAKSIEFLGYVSDAERDRLFASCRAFIFASEEDFGIVPVEAMSYGKPVIAYGRGGGSESVIPGKTGLHFHDQTPESLIYAVSQFEKKTFSPQAIAKHAQQFSDTRFRQEIMEYIVSAVEGMKPSKR